MTPKVRARYFYELGRLAVQTGTDTPALPINPQSEIRNPKSDEEAR
jgi:hypothetical protein